MSHSARRAGRERTVAASSHLTLAGALDSLQYSSCTTPLTRLLSWLRASRPHNGYATNRRLAGSSWRECGDVKRERKRFPSHALAGAARLVQRSADPASRRIAQRSCARRLAWILSECQVAVFDYFALDCPKTATQYRCRLGPQCLTSAQNYALEQFVLPATSASAALVRVSLILGAACSIFELA